MTPEQIATDHCDRRLCSTEKICVSCQGLVKDIKHALSAQQERFLEIVYGLTHDESGLAEGDPTARMLMIVGDKIERKIRGKLKREKP